MEKLNFEDWNIEELTGHKPLTTSYMDFSIAERFGRSAVFNTYSKLFEKYKDDYKLLTELAVVLNWKIWQHYKSNESLARVYNFLLNKADYYAHKNLKEKELLYFHRILTELLINIILFKHH